MAIIVLDSTPLGLAATPSTGSNGGRVREWLAALGSSGHRIVVPEVADYEVRRKLLHKGLDASVERLDTLKARLDYWPITTAAMLRAAGLWAHLRRIGRPTAGPDTLDADAILAVQALAADIEGEAVIVATANLKHLSLFPGLDARYWETIGPRTE